MTPYIFWICSLVCLLGGNYQWLRDNKQTEIETTYIYTVIDKNGNVVWEGNGVRLNREAMRAIIKRTTK